LHLRRFLPDINPYTRKIFSFHPKRRIPPSNHHPNLSEAYNLDDDLDGAFFGFRRSVSKIRPHPLYARPCTIITITTDMTTMFRIVVTRQFRPVHLSMYTLYPLSRASPPRRPIIGHCISYGNHKSRIIRIYSKEMQDCVHSRLTRVIFDEEKIQRSGSAIGICLVASPLPLSLSASCSLMFATSLHSVVVLLLGRVVPKAVPPGTTSSSIECLSRG
jgi:hypothetical protein